MEYSDEFVFEVNFCYQNFVMQHWKQVVYFHSFYYVGIGIPMETINYSTIQIKLSRTKLNYLQLAKYARLLSSEEDGWGWKFDGGEGEGRGFKSTLTGLLSFT